MKHRLPRIVKDFSIVLSFAIFIGVVGFFAKNELGFLLGSVRPSPAIAAQEEIVIIDPDPVPLASAPASAPASQPLLDSVATPATPSQLIIPAIDIDQPITEYTDDMVAERGGINPEGWFTVAWWSGGGFPNASPDNSPVLTTFLYGHSTNVPSNKIIFDDIGLLVAGDNILIKTDKGDFSYAVESVLKIPKSDALADPSVTENAAGRLVLISCWGESPNIGAKATHNIVVVAQQTSAPSPA